MNYGFGTCLPVQYEQKKNKSMEGGKKRNYRENVGFK